MDNRTYTAKEARTSLWDWFAFGEYENLKENTLPDAQDEILETHIRAALGVLCQAVGDHSFKLKSPDGPYCVLCWKNIEDEDS